MIRFLGRIFTAFCCGLVLSLWIIQNNPHVQKQLTIKLVTLLEDMWDVNIKAKQVRANFFTCSIYFDHATIKPRRSNKQFSWGMSDGKVYISPFKYLLKKKIALYITLNNARGASGHNGTSYDLVDHISDIINGPISTLNVSIKTVTINNIQLDLTHKSNKLTCTLPGSFSISKDKINKKVGQKWAGTLTSVNGQLQLNDHTFLHTLNGSTSFFTTKKNSTMQYSGLHTFIAPNIDKTNIYSLTTLWTMGQKQLTLEDTKKSLSLKGNGYDKGLTLTGTTSLQTLLSLPSLFAQQEPELGKIDGQCSINLDCLTHGLDVAAQGTLVVTDAQYKNISVKMITADIKNITSTKATIHLAANVRPGVELEGVCTANFTDGTGSLGLKNSKQIPLNQAIAASLKEWIIVPKCAVFNAIISTANGITCTGRYALRFLNQVTEKEYPYTGSFSFNKTDGQILGTSKTGAYTLQGSFKEYPFITRLFYAGKEHTLIDLHTHENNSILEGTIRYNFLMSLFPHNLRHLALGHDCICWLSLEQKNPQLLTGSVGLHSGRLYIPENRNLIERFHTKFKLLPAHNRLLLNDFEVGFCKGSIKSPQMTLQYDDQFNVDLLHIPLQIDNLFVNWKKDFYGFIYGNLLFNKLPFGSPKVSGNIVLKKTLLRENMFADVGSSNIYSPMGNVNTLLQNFAVDLFITNEKPIKAKTPTLETFANLNLRVQYLPNKDLILTPHVTGSINLDHGYLQFLQNKLFIEYGKIQFIPNQMNDPLIDLVAKNKINRYQVTLQATGSLQKPTIILESSPELTEEQILGLIFVGSENATLQADLPLMLVQNLHSLMLGSNKLFPQKNNLIEKITRPFKYVQIIPNFTDVSGRGGIKGVVSVNLSDQLKAQVQKNLNFQDDFSAQLEYALTDDINFKVVKDQREELGSEVELRVKL